jgi:ABC-2 type transport system permease protein
MVPGILVQLLTLVGTMMTAMNIVREQEIGTLDQLNVTPMSRSAFIAAKLLPLLSIAIVIFAVGLGVARWGFGVPVVGSLTLLFATAILYLIVSLALGLWVSTIVSTQQQAMFVSFFMILIYLLMSGLFTPVRSMPEWAQWIAEVNPVKHIIVILRAVMLKGAGLTDILRPLGILAVTGAVALTFSIRQYAKQAH